MTIHIIEGSLKRDLLELTLAEAPREAVGLIYEGRVYTLSNASSEPEHNFEVHLSELRELIISLSIPWDRLATEVAFWHSHPSGGVGPSRTDMVNRTPLKHHLVVSLVEGDLVPTWY